MSLILAYPSDPFNPQKVDADFLEEVQRFAANGFSIIRLSEDLRPLNPNILKTSTVPILYRGWMLSPQQYATLEQHFASRLLIRTQTYLTSHHIVNWVQPLAAAHLTAPTTILPFQSISDVLHAFNSLPLQRWFVKDYVKSLKTAPGPLVSNREELNECLVRMEQYRGLIEGGVALREIQHFQPHTEQRFFVANNQLFGNTATLSPEDLERIQSAIEILRTQHPRPFYSLDIARLANTNQLTIVEIGDGQVSDYAADSSTEGLELSTFVKAVQHLATSFS